MIFYIYKQSSDILNSINLTTLLKFKQKENVANKIKHTKNQNTEENSCKNCKLIRF